jgi:hypothetical protein
MSSTSTSASPKIVFIVPYRNRIQHKFYFSTYLTAILKDSPDSYEIYFSHQTDTRSFNRGGTKNIGFLAVKSKYPETYKDMTFVFNDIDTVPFSNIFDYKTTSGIVKHFYGFNYALGGIVSITGSDFEKINGFPSFWGWGMEDAVLHARCEKHGLEIDRSNFYPIGSPNILQFFDGVSRLINRKDHLRAKNDNGIDGVRTIHKLDYSIDKESSNPQDNIHVSDSKLIFIINIKTFMTATHYEENSFHEYDLREPQQKIMNPEKARVNTNKQYATTDTWTNIPFYPTAEKRNEMVKQYGQVKAEEIIEYSYNNSTDPTKEVMPPPPSNINLKPSNLLQQQLQLIQIQQYNEQMRQHNSSARIIPPNVNKFSPAYSRIIAAKPKANKSANVRLGGIY